MGINIHGLQAGGLDGVLGILLWVDLGNVLLQFDLGDGG